MPSNPATKQKSSAPSPPPAPVSVPAMDEGLDSAITALREKLDAWGRDLEAGFGAWRAWEETLEVRSAELEDREKQLAGNRVESTTRQAAANDEQSQQIAEALSAKEAALAQEQALRRRVAEVEAQRDETEGQRAQAEGQRAEAEARCLALSEQLDAAAQQDIEAADQSNAEVDAKLAEIEARRQALDDRELELLEREESLLQQMAATEAVDATSALVRDVPAETGDVADVPGPSMAAGAGQKVVEPKGGVTNDKPALVPIVARPRKQKKAPAKKALPIEAPEDVEETGTQDPVEQAQGDETAAVPPAVPVVEQQPQSQPEVAASDEQAVPDIAALDLDPETQQRLKVLRRIAGPNKTDAELLGQLRQRGQAPVSKELEKKRWWKR